MSGGTLYARMFAPGLGMEEDPATGSAAAALAAALGDRSTEREGDFTWSIDQGVRIGRPSRIEAVARKKDGKLVSVEVGGPSVVVGEGFMTASTARGITAPPHQDVRGTDLSNSAPGDLALARVRRKRPDPTGATRTKT